MIRVQKTLAEWYRINRRELPWRLTKDPYRILVSEVMLQQTGVDTVIPYFLSFIKRFPAIETLAESSPEEVLRAWEGLGYYRRAKNLHSAARILHGTYHNEVPRDYSAVIQLPGVGVYTAGAVLSIAYDLPYICLDGNMHRVFSRLYMDESMKTVSEETKYTRHIGTEYIVYAHEQGILPSVFNQAYMELGAVICLPENPRCDSCPVMSFCIARTCNSQKKHPLKKVKTPPIVKDMEVAILWVNQRMLFEKREGYSLLKNLWGLPTVEKLPGKKPGITLLGYLKERYGIVSSVPKYLFKVRHAFTHQIWHMTVYQAFAKNPCSDVRNEGVTLTNATEEESRLLPVPKTYRKVLEQYTSRKIRVVAAILRNAEGQVFIAQRKPGGFFGGLWEFPGGKIEEGESEEAAIVRELSEELNIQAKPTALLYRSTYPYPFGRLEISFFHCEILSGSIFLSEHERFLWIDDDGLDSTLFPPADAEFIAILKSKELRQST